MKNIIFLALTFSSFFAVACGDNDTESIGGSASDSTSADIGYAENINPLSGSKPGLVVTDCNLGKIIVRGFYIRSWGGGGLNGVFWSSFPPVNALLTFLNLSQNFGCSSSKLDREVYANMIFAEESALALANSFDDWAQFIAEHPNGSDYTVYWPDGSVGTYYVTNPLSSSNPTHNETSMSGC